MIIRPRRLRQSAGLRAMLQETRLAPRNFISPLFVVSGKGVKEPIAAMPGQYHFSVDTLVKEISELKQNGILSVLLFGIPDQKDAKASRAYADDGIVPQAVKAIKDKLPEMTVITDVCLCAYTDHGHCGVATPDGRIDNDATLDLLARQALSHAKAGADFTAPSDMMDGRVAAIRAALNQHHFPDVGIISYAVKYASAFYGPFREATDCAPQFGDRKTYQMDPANTREALKEALLDIEEGADMIMVKPALAYLDIISLVRVECLLPVVAYNVSGEYSMVKAAAEKGWLDETKIMLEMLLSIKRAGADLIVTYFAKEAAAALRDE
ncbi:MAG: porphobilinogen synthase [Desulfobacteraceae bacterium]|nr:MAG: porphobilinogen synthase [Desulfobacteraceae bacterium]